MNNNMMLDEIKVEGAREHNLKNISVTIPKNKITVITGLSGSGKSSLAFDTIYAEGQRRYMESLSAYARQFLDQMDKPDVDRIEGLSPAISIDQKSGSKNPRSTVGTITEIYDYLRLLFSSVGVPHCVNCQTPIEKLSVQEMVAQLQKWPSETVVTVMAPLEKEKKGEFKQLFQECLNKGFRRVEVNGEFRRCDEEIKLDKKKKHTINLVVDRLDLGEANQSRLFESIETALSQSNGLLLAENNTTKERLLLSEHLSCPVCAFSIAECSARFFSFNSPIGACQTCNGLGEFKDFDPDLLIKFPDQPLFKSTANILNLKRTNLGRLVTDVCRECHIDTEIPFAKLSEKKKNILLYGTESVNREAFSSQNTVLEQTHWKGFIPLLRQQFSMTYSERRKFYFRFFMSSKTCLSCHGFRLNSGAQHVQIHGYTMKDFISLQLGDLLQLMQTIPFTDAEEVIIKQVKKEIINRLTFLKNVGLGYLNLNRRSGTLSGGEFQRIRLATQIGSALTGVLYVLDEPSIGLHQKDNEQLIKTLRSLCDLGNTLIVVEHDEATILAADYVIEIGPKAGEAGGNVVFAGGLTEFLASDSLTAHYLTQKKTIEVPTHRRKPKNRGKISLKNVSEHNLKNISVDFPLGQLICVTGVSGSGKSTLIYDVLHKAVLNHFNETKEKVGKFEKILGLSNIDKIITIDQSPIGRTPRSNPVTYVGVFSAIRDLFCQTREAKIRGYKPGRFSFNVKGGRCESCEGDGLKKIEMHFLSDVFVTCDVCKGARYNLETLEVTYKGKSIAAVLDLTVNKACDLFENIPAIFNKLKVLQEVGLGYIRLGQSATSLSGGEAQRIKLAKELSKKSTGQTLYLLDEPTTGLHFEDIKQLLNVINKLVDTGNTAIIIEHNLDVIKTADHIIDIGPEGGDNGGNVVVKGCPEQVAANKQSVTGMYLSDF